MRLSTLLFILTSVAEVAVLHGAAPAAVQPRKGELTTTTASSYDGAELVFKCEIVAIHAYLLICIRAYPHLYLFLYLQVMLLLRMPSPWQLCLLWRPPQ